jgi:NAD+ kinase
MPERFQRVGLIVNTDKPACRPAARLAARLIRQSGREVWADHLAVRFAGLKLATSTSSPNPSSLARRVDLLLVFGGDGTMLRVAREIAPAPTPLFGLNLGGLGFLTGASARRLKPALEALWNGETQVETRAMIEARSDRRVRPLREIALNDLVISRGVASRLIELEVSVDDQFLTRYRCDGLVIGTPTGSTAYSLAAGGPIVSPDAAVMTLTPICPHTLSNRPLIVSLNSVLAVKVISRRLEVNLTADGQVQSPLESGETVLVQRSRWQARLLRPSRVSFYETLRQKLRWSGSTV